MIRRNKTAKQPNCFKSELRLTNTHAALSIQINNDQKTAYAALGGLHGTPSPIVSSVLELKARMSHGARVHPMPIYLRAITSDWAAHFLSPINQLHVILILVDQPISPTVRMLDSVVPESTFQKFVDILDGLFADFSMFATAGDSAHAVQSDWVGL
jgi:hypothetical protein